MCLLGCGGIGMNWWQKILAQLRQVLKQDEIHEHSPCAALPILVHAHAKGEVPPGPLEDEMTELEQEGLVLHAITEIVRADGTFGDLPEDRIEWARRLSYRHLKREGCLEAYGLPNIPAYEDGKPV